MHRVMGVDIETYSSVDLAKAGVYAYAEAPDFEVLIIGYKFDDEEGVHVIDCTLQDANGNPLISRPDAPEEFVTFMKALTDPRIIKTAYNANFERTCLAAWTGAEMPPEQWRCTMVKALTLGLPRGLADVGIAMGLPADKLKDPQGKALIQYFSKPCKPTKANEGRTRNLPFHDPAKWGLYLSYNRQDVVTEQEILRRLSLYETTKEEQDLWSLDQRMNDDGVRVDIPMVEKIVKYDAMRREELAQEARGLTGLKNPNSLAQLKGWLADRGVPVEQLRKDDIARMLGEDLPDDVRRVLEIRQALGKTSVAKYSAMLTAACRDGRLRGILQFYGANRSGRWAGKLVQTHNLARNSLPDLDVARELVCEGDFDSLQTLFGETSFVFSELVRTAFIPSEGCRFVVSDFSAIEARVISWVAGEEWRLQAFQDGKDIYCETASQMYHVPVVKHGVNGDLRQKGKVAELACIARGQLVLTDRGLVPIENVTTSMKLWDGVEWVSHDGVICKGKRRTINYGGLEATEDHIVWAEIDGQYYRVRFGDAARSGSRLIQSGAGRQAVRLAQDNISGKTVHEGVERVLRSDGMHWMRPEELDKTCEHDAGKDERLPELQSAQSRTSLARPEVHSSETEMREPERRGLQELWSTGDTFRVPERNGCLPLHDRDVRPSGQTDGNRPNRCERKLRSGKHEMGHASAELSKPEEVYDTVNAGPRHRFTVSGVLVHNCGYQGGVGAMKQMDRGGTIPEEELQSVVDQWRQANPRIVKLWRTAEAAAKTAIEEHRPVRIRNGIAFSYVNGNLFIQLPSGRKLCYWETRLVPDDRGRQSIVYKGVNQTTKQWADVETYGGKIVENIVQAIARDCLAVAMTRVAQAGYRIVMHVHDEMIVDVPVEDTGALAFINAQMAEPIDWAPGLPLKGDGYICDFYQKD